MPGKKPTNDELMERVEFVQELLCRGVNYGTIKRLVRERYGPLHFTTIGRLVLRARKQFARDIQRTSLLEARAEQVRFCRSVMADPNARAIEKLKASERIAALLGLDMPLKHELNAKQSVTYRTPVTIDYAELERLRREAEGVPQGDGGGQPVPDAAADGAPGSVPGIHRN